MQISGNCYKVRLLLHHLSIPFERVEVARGEARKPEFLRMNPIGRVPTVELGPGVFLAESNAILWYFAEGTPYVPTDRLARARVLQWMFFEQYSHEPYVAVARAWLRYFGIPPGKEAELAERQERGYAALETMESELTNRDFFAGDAYSIADISLYAYTHVAHEGGFDLFRFKALHRWFERVRSQPGHIPIEA
jgi:glutathione S-transferase